MGNKIITSKFKKIFISISMAILSIGIVLLTVFAVIKANSSDNIPEETTKERLLTYDLDDKIPTSKLKFEPISGTTNAKFVGFEMGSGEALQNSTLSIPETVTISNVEYTITEVDTNALWMDNSYIFTTIDNVNYYYTNLHYYSKDIVKALILPSTITKINNGAFYGMASLEYYEAPFAGLTAGDEVYPIHKAFAKGFFTEDPADNGADGTEYQPQYFNTGQSLVASIAKWHKIGQSEIRFYVPKNLSVVHLTGGTKYGTRTFSDFTELREVVLPESLISVGEYTFTHCTSITDITLPKNLTTLSVGMFDQCTSLLQITIPNGITSIPNNAFNLCTNVNDVRIPTSVTEIGTDAFSHCENLGLNLYRMDGNNLVLLDNPNEVNLPDGLISIGARAFQNVESITKITIPNNLSSIGEAALQNCTNVTDITLPFIGKCKGSASDDKENNFGYIFGFAEQTAGLYRIKQNNGTYSIPQSLKAINVTNETAVESMVLGNLAYIINNTVVDSGVETITINSNVSSIDAGAMAGSNKLTTVTIPFIGSTDNKTAFGRLFYYSDEMRNRDIISAAGTTDSEQNGETYKVPDTVETIIVTNQVEIYTGSFHNLINVQNVEIYDDVTTKINQNIFYKNNKLTSVTLPFVGYTRGEEYHWWWWWYDYMQYNQFSWVFSPKNHGNTYDDRTIAPYSNSDAYVRRIPNSLRTVRITDETVIGSYAFRNLTSVTDLIIEDGGQLSTIQEQCAMNCNRLINLSVPWIGGNKNVNSDAGASHTIGYLFGTTEYSYSYIATAYKKYYIPKSLKTITVDYVDEVPDYAFANITGVSTVTFSTQVSGIGDYAFYNMKDLSSINYTRNTDFNKIDSHAFDGCKKINYIQTAIPRYSSGDDIILGDYALANTSISTIDFTKFRDVGSYAFSGLLKLREVHVTNNIEKFGDGVFANCTYLDTVTLSDGQATKYLFMNCVSLTNIDLTGGIIADRTIPTGIFYNCKSLVWDEVGTPGLKITDQIDKIGGSAFYNCESLTKFIIPTNVRIIEDLAFYGCPNLESVIIPRLTTSIGVNVFSEPTNERDNFIIWVYLNEENWPQGWMENWSCLHPVKVIGADDESIYEYSQYNAALKGYIITGIKSGVTFNGLVRLPSSHDNVPVRGIIEGLFEGRQDVHKVIIPSSINAIGEDAFKIGGRIDIFFEDSFDNAPVLLDNTFNPTNTRLNTEAALLEIVPAPCYGLYVYGGDWTYGDGVGSDITPYIKLSSLTYNFLLDPTPIYSGIAHTPTITSIGLPGIEIVSGDGLIISPDMFDYEYSNNISAGTARVTARLDDSSYRNYRNTETYPLLFAGTGTATFEIEKADIDIFLVSETGEQTFLGRDGEHIIHYTGKLWEYSSWNSGNCSILDGNSGYSFEGTIATCSPNAGEYDINGEEENDDFYWKKQWKVLLNNRNVTSNFNVWVYLNVIVSKLPVTLQFVDGRLNSDVYEYQYNGPNGVVPVAKAFNSNGVLENGCIVENWFDTRNFGDTGNPTYPNDTVIAHAKIDDSSTGNYIADPVQVNQLVKIIPATVTITINKQGENDYIIPYDATSFSFSDWDNTDYYSITGLASGSVLSGKIINTGVNGNAANVKGTYTGDSIQWEQQTFNLGDYYYNNAKTLVDDWLIARYDEDGNITKVENDYYVIELDVTVRISYNEFTYKFYVGDEELDINYDEVTYVDGVAVFEADYHCDGTTGKTFKIVITNDGLSSSPTQPNIVYYYDNYTRATGGTTIEKEIKEIKTFTITSDVTRNNFNQKIVEVQLHSIKCDIEHKNLTKQYDGQEVTLENFITRKGTDQTVSLQFLDKDKNLMTSGGPVNPGTYYVRMSANEGAFFNGLDEDDDYEFKILPKDIYIYVDHVNYLDENSELFNSKNYNGSDYSITINTNTDSFTLAQKQAAGLVGNDNIQGVLHTKSADTGIYDAEVDGDWVWYPVWSVYDSVTLATKTSYYNLVLVGQFEIKELEFTYTVSCNYDYDPVTERYSGNYDGANHSLTINVTQPATGATIQYMEGAYEQPVWNDETEKWDDPNTWRSFNYFYTSPGTYVVSFKISAPHYKTVYQTRTIEIKYVSITYDRPSDFRDDVIGTENVIVIDYDTYDHQLEIVVSDPLGATVQYILEKYDTNVGYQPIGDGRYTTTIPTVKALGQYRLKYIITAIDYETVESEYVFYVTDRFLDEISGSYILANGYSGVYDGSPHSITLTITDPTIDGLATKEYRRSLTEVWSTSAPQLVNVGSYTIYYRITAQGYQPKEGNVQVSITPATMQGISVTGHSGVFDGEEHFVTTNANDLYPNATVYYTTNSDVANLDVEMPGWSTTAPSILNVGTINVFVRVVLANYFDVDLTTTLVVTRNMDVVIDYTPNIQVQYMGYGVSVKYEDLGVETIHDGMVLVDFFPGVMTAGTISIDPVNNTMSSTAIELGYYWVEITFKDTANCNGKYIAFGFEIVKRRVLAEYEEQVEYNGQGQRPKAENSDKVKVVSENDYDLYDDLNVTMVREGATTDPKEIGIYYYSFDLISDPLFLSNYELVKPSAAQYPYSFEITKRNLPVEINTSKDYDFDNPTPWTMDNGWTDYNFSQKLLPGHVFNGHMETTGFLRGTYFYTDNPNVANRVLVSNVIITNGPLSYTVAPTTYDANIKYYSRTIDYREIAISSTSFIEDTYFVIDDNGDFELASEYVSGKIYYEAVYVYNYEDGLNSYEFNNNSGNQYYYISNDVTDYYNITYSITVNIKYPELNVEVKTDENNVVYDGYYHQLELDYPYGATVEYALKSEYEEDPENCWESSLMNKNVGTYTIYYRVRTHYGESIGFGTLNIAKATLAIEVDPFNDVIYNARVQNITHRITNVYGVNAGSAGAIIKYYDSSIYDLEEIETFYEHFNVQGTLYENGLDSIIDAGTYYVVVYYPDNMNWNSNFVVRTVTIKQRRLYVTLGYDFTSNREYIEGTYYTIGIGRNNTVAVIDESSPDGLLNNHTITRSSSSKIRTVSDNAGTYDGATGFEFDTSVIIRDLSRNNVTKNYKPIVTDPGIITINPIPLPKFIVTDNVMTYDGTPAKPNIDTPATGEITYAYYKIDSNGDEQLSNADEAKNVGEYRVYCRVDAHGNYLGLEPSSRFESAIVTVVPKDVEVIWENSVVDFNGTNQIARAYFINVRGERVDLNVKARNRNGSLVDNVLNAGEYEVYAYYDDSDMSPNYNLNGTTSTFKINKITYTFNIVDTTDITQTVWAKQFNENNITAVYDSADADKFIVGRVIPGVSITGANGTGYAYIKTISSQSASYYLISDFNLSDFKAVNSAGVDVSDSFNFAFSGMVSIVSQQIVIAQLLDSVVYDGNPYRIIGDVLSVVQPVKTPVNWELSYYSDYRASNPSITVTDANVYIMYYRVSASGYDSVEGSFTFTIDKKESFINFSTSLDKTYNGVAVGVSDVKEIIAGEFNGVKDDLIIKFYHVGSATPMNTNPVDAGEYRITIESSKDTDSTFTKNYTNLENIERFFVIKAKTVKLKIEEDYEVTPTTLNIVYVGTEVINTNLYGLGSYNNLIYQFKSVDTFYDPDYPQFSYRGIYKYADLVFYDENSSEQRFTSFRVGDDFDFDFDFVWTIYSTNRTIQSGAKIKTVDGTDYLDVSYNYCIDLDYTINIHYPYMQVNIEDVNVPYDGNSHAGNDTNAISSPSNFVALGGVKMYGDINTALAVTSIGTFARTVPGTHVINYRYECEGYEPFEGSFKIIIGYDTRTIYKNEINLSKEYDGLPAGTLQNGKYLPTIARLEDSGSSDKMLILDRGTSNMVDNYDASQISIKYYKIGYRTPLDNVSDSGNYSYTLTIPESDYYGETVITGNFTIRKKSIFVDGNYYANYTGECISFSDFYGLTSPFTFYYSDASVVPSSVRIDNLVIRTNDSSVKHYVASVGSVSYSGSPRIRINNVDVTSNYQVMLSGISLDNSATFDTIITIENGVFNDNILEINNPTEEYDPNTYRTATIRVLGSIQGLSLTYCATQDGDFHERDTANHEFESIPVKRDSNGDVVPYTFYAKLSAPNYNDRLVTLQYTIVPANTTVDFEKNKVEYKGEAIAYPGKKIITNNTDIGTLNQDGTVYTYSFSYQRKNDLGNWEDMPAGETPIDAGEYKVSILLTNSPSGNYNGGVYDLFFEITSVEAILNWDQFAFIYNGEIQKPVATFTKKSTDPGTGYRINYTITPSNVDPINVGLYTITAKLVDITDENIEITNYVFNDNNKTINFTILPREVTVFMNKTFEFQQGVTPTYAMDEDDGFTITNLVPGHMTNSTLSPISYVVGKYNDVSTRTLTKNTWNTGDLIILDGNTSQGGIVGNYPDVTSNYVVNYNVKLNIDFSEINYTVIDYSGDYDGAPHRIKVVINNSFPDDHPLPSITYSETADGNFSSNEITQTDAGTYRIYFRITLTGYNPIGYTVQDGQIIQDPDSYGTIVINKLNAGLRLADPDTTFNKVYDGVATSNPMMAFDTPGLGQNDVEFKYYQLDDTGSYVDPDNNLRYSLLNSNPINVGQYLLKASLGATTNFENGSFRREFEITQRPILITINSNLQGQDTMTYNGYAWNQDVSNSEKVVYNIPTLENPDVGLINGHEFRNSIIQTVSVNARTYYRVEDFEWQNTSYEIYNGVNDVSENYSVTYSLRVVISKAQFAFTSSGYSGTYNAEAHTISVNVTTPSTRIYQIYYSTTNNDQDYTLNEVFRTEVGTTTVYFKLIDPSGNYAEKKWSEQIVITGVDLTGTLIFDETVIYGNPYRMPFYDCPSRGTQTVSFYEFSDENYLYPLELEEGAKPTAAGKYRFKIELASDGIYASGTFKGQYTIQKRKVTVNWIDAQGNDTLTKTFAGRNQDGSKIFLIPEGRITDTQLTADYSGAEYVSVSIADDYKQSEVGEYTVVATFADSNYELENYQQTFKIVPQGVDILDVKPDMEFIYYFEKPWLDLNGDPVCDEDNNPITLKYGQNVRDNITNQGGTIYYVLGDDNETIIGYKDSIGNITPTNYLFHFELSEDSNADKMVNNQMTHHTLKLVLNDTHNYVWNVVNNNQDREYEYIIKPYSLPYADEDTFVSANIPDLYITQEVEGQEIKPEPTVWFKQRINSIDESIFKMIDAIDPNDEERKIEYVVTYENNDILSSDNVKAHVIVTGINNFDFTVDIVFNIVESAPETLKLVDGATPIFMQVVFSNSEVLITEDNTVERNDLNKANIYLGHIHQDTTIDTMLYQFENSRSTIKVYKNNVLVTNYNDYVGTGTVFKLYNDRDEEIDSIEAILFGDLDGDGSITVADSTVYKHIIGAKITFNGVQDGTHLTDSLYINNNFHSMTNYYATIVTRNDGDTSPTAGLSTILKNYISGKVTNFNAEYEISLM